MCKRSVNVYEVILCEDILSALLKTSFVWGIDAPWASNTSLRSCWSQCLASGPLQWEQWGVLYPFCTPIQGGSLHVCNQFCDHTCNRAETCWQQQLQSQQDSNTSWISRPFHLPWKLLYLLIELRAGRPRNRDSIRRKVKWYSVSLRAKTNSTTK